MNSNDQILMKNGWIKRSKEIDFNFQEIENVIGFKIPNDYKNYATNFESNQNFIGKEYVNLWDVNNLMKYNIEYKILEKLPKILAIGDNGNGEFIGIEYINDNKVEIILSTFIDLDPEYNIVIGKSFTEFLARLDDGNKWFN